LFLHGTNDTVVPPVEVERVVNKLRTQKGIIIDYELEEGATHFWQDHIGAVDTRVGAYLDKRLTEKPA
ncbi:MAG: alpha/beta hydrolase, partial [Brevundimonas sp.]|nr:alpha/beta hydrolase [Brevundimonas sp.]